MNFLSVAGCVCHPVVSWPAQENRQRCNDTLQAEWKLGSELFYRRKSLHRQARQGCDIATVLHIVYIHVHLSPPSCALYPAVQGFVCSQVKAVASGSPSPYSPPPVVGGLWPYSCLMRLEAADSAHRSASSGGCCVRIQNSRGRSGVSASLD